MPGHIQEESQWHKNKRDFRYFPLYLHGYIHSISTFKRLKTNSKIIDQSSTMEFMSNVLQFSTVEFKKFKQASRYLKCRLLYYSIVVYRCANPSPYDINNREGDSKVCSILALAILRCYTAVSYLYTGSVGQWSA